METAVSPATMMWSIPIIYVLLDSVFARAELALGHGPDPGGHKLRFICLSLSSGGEPRCLGLIFDIKNPQTPHS